MQRRLITLAVVLRKAAFPLHVVATCMLLAGCATAQGVHTADTPAQPICLPMATYTHAEQAKAAGELQALPPGATLGRFMVDYGTLRAANRALCAK